MAKVAFIGLGVMGYPMAGHLSAGGHDVTVYNRTAAKAKKWVKKYGGKSARTPREAAKNKEFVFICVGNDDDLRSVVLSDKGALAGMSKGSILIDNTTASANVARELHATARKAGVGFIDAPVSGGQAGAENGVLTVMCGGRKIAFQKSPTRHRLFRPTSDSDRRTRIGSTYQDGQSNLYRRSCPRPFRRCQFRPQSRTRHE